MQAQTVTADPNYVAGNYKTLAQQETFCSSLKGSEPPVTVDVTVNNGTKVADYRLQGNAVHYSKTDMEFRSKEGGISFRVPIERSATNPVNIRGLYMGHAVAGYLDAALRLLRDDTAPLTLRNFSLWSTHLQETRGKAARFEFLLNLGPLLGVTLTPPSAIVPPNGKSDPGAYEQRMLVKAVLHAFVHLDSLAVRGLDLTESDYAVAGIPMARLLSRRWRRDRKSDADVLENRVIEDEEPIGRVVEELERAAKKD